MKNSFEKDLKEKLMSQDTPDYWDGILKKIKAGKNIDYKHKKIVKLRNWYTYVAAGIAIIVCSVIFLNQFVGMSTNNTDTAQIQSEQDNNIVNEAVNKIENNIYINQVSSLAKSKIKLPEGYYSENMTYTQYTNSVGLNKIMKLPSDMSILRDSTKVYYNSDGSIFMMNGFKFELSSNEDKYIKIRIQKDTIPLTDLLYELSTEIESNIGNSKLVIGYNKESDIYISNFINNGIGFSLEAKAISQEEVVKFIESIVE